MSKFNEVIPTKFGRITIEKVGEVEIPMFQWFGYYLRKLQNYLNNLSFSNINVPSNSIPIGKLDIGEIHFPLCLPASNYTTTSTSGANIGAYFYWNPAAFPSGKWYLEASIATSGGTATLTLKGATDIKTLTTTSSGMANKREQVTMPATAQNLYLNLKVSSSSYTAALGGARLILVPQG